MCIAVLFILTALDDLLKPMKHFPVVARNQEQEKNEQRNQRWHGRQSKNKKANKKANSGQSRTTLQRIQRIQTTLYSSALRSLDNFAARDQFFQIEPEDVW